MSPAVAQTLPIISLMLVGFLLRQAGLLRPNDGQVLSRLIINTTLPAVIFLSVARAAVAPGHLALLALCGLLVAVGQKLVASWLVGWLKLERRVAGVVIIATMVVNVGFFLFPIFLAVYGTEGISRLAAFDVGNSLVASSYGYYLATCFGDNPSCSARQSLKRALSLPMLWAALLGLAVNLGRVTLPSYWVKLLEPLGAANTPLAMVTLGSYIQFRYSHWKPMALAVALRMGLGFVLGQTLVYLTQLQGLERIAVTLGAAMPSGMVVLVYAAAEGLDTEFAAGVVSSGLLAGLFVAPALLSVYG
jgi:predicted permease